jgi:hypothetical protein
VRAARARSSSQSSFSSSPGLRPASSRAIIAGSWGVSRVVGCAVHERRGSLGAGSRPA